MNSPERNELRTLLYNNQIPDICTRFFAGLDDDGDFLLGGGIVLRTERERVKTPIEMLIVYGSLMRFYPDCFESIGVKNLHPLNTFTPANVNKSLLTYKAYSPSLPTLIYLYCQIQKYSSMLKGDAFYATSLKLDTLMDKPFLPSSVDNFLFYTYASTKYLEDLFGQKDLRKLVNYDALSKDKITFLPWFNVPHLASRQLPSKQRSLPQKYNLPKKYNLPTLKTIYKVYWRKYLKDWIDYDKFKTYDSYVTEKLNDFGLRFKQRVVARLLWNSEKSVNVTFTAINGNVPVTIPVHYHSLAAIVQKKGQQIGLPDRYYDFNSEYVTRLAEFLSPQLQKSYSDIDFVKPFKDISVLDNEQFISFKNCNDLIVEGHRMRHCINGAGWCDRFAGGQYFGFHYIPKGVSKDDFKKHFTVTFEIEMFRRNMVYATPYYHGDDSLSLEHVKKRFDDGQIQDYKANDRAASAAWEMLKSKNDLMRYMGPGVCDFGLPYMYECKGFLNELPTEEMLNEIMDFIYTNRDHFTKIGKDYHDYIRN